MIFDLQSSTVGCNNMLNGGGGSFRGGGVTVMIRKVEGAAAV